ncbi:MAG: MFS transporter, partial [Alphaproteobacteria bacterium]|nr:MFS transporter [Alphaproteobacteria bacterium]
MIDAMRRPRLHYAWIVVATMLVLMMLAATIRFSAGILVVPMERELGWSRADIALAAGIGLFLWGAIGPFAAIMYQRIGV